MKEPENLCRVSERVNPCMVEGCGEPAVIAQSYTATPEGGISTLTINGDRFDCYGFTYRRRFCRTHGEAVMAFRFGPRDPSAAMSKPNRPTLLERIRSWI